MTTLTALIPTYRRPQDLARCLEALKQQSRLADEVIVVVRDHDAETWTFLEKFDPKLLNLRTLTVSAPGVVAALNTGLDGAKGDIIAITDDDAAPHVDWLSRIEAHFLSDSGIGGVGGRDWRYNGTQLEDGVSEVVGQVQWFGRLIGNHHIGVGEPREVDVLKGANMSFRRNAIAKVRFDERLLGTGAQVHNEMALSLAVKQAGWKLIYDPAVAVDHYESSRWTEDRVGHFNSSTLAVFNSSYNEALILLDYLPIIQSIVYIIWSFLIGTRQAPGVLQAIRFTRQFKLLAWQRFLATQHGKFSAFSKLIRNKLTPSSTFTSNITDKQNSQQAETTASVRPISVAIIAQNEEARISNAIRSCLTFADEIVVVDGGSQDSTVQLAENLGCKVYVNPWPGYAKQRNFAAQKATYEWIFFVDSDEFCSETLGSALLAWKNTPQIEANAFAVDRVGDFLGEWLDNTADYQIRLYNKNIFKITDVLVHEKPDVGDAPVIKLPGILWHQGFRSIDDHVKRFNHYTSLEAEKAYLEHKKFSWFRLLIRPPARFIQKYIMHGMCKKGLPGFVVAVIWTYYELLREIKLYEIYWKQNKDIEP